MESYDDESRRFDDRATSDLVVRIRTQDGRDEWIYCHSQVLAMKSKYFADRLSDTWPTCQILDSRNCVEVCCEEIDFDSYIAVLRLIYSSEIAVSDLGSIKNALGILRVAFELGCPGIVSSCVDYMEAAPWEESEEEEILKVIPSMGSGMERVLARLQPVDPAAIHGVFLSAIRFATSSPPSAMNDLKTSAQEQLEYMLTEDEDAPLLIADEEVKSEAKQCISTMFSRFVSLVDSAISDVHCPVFGMGKSELLISYLSDLSWASQILTKLECPKEFISSWVEISPNMVKLIDQVESQGCSSVGIKFKILELSGKVLEAIGCGNVILPTITRLHMVKLWLPFSSSVKRAVDSSPSDDENELLVKSDGEFWQSLESSFVSIILTLPSTDQAEILKEWLESEDAKYPDLGEAFEVWCYRSKVARRRLGLVDESNPSTEEAS